MRDGETKVTILRESESASIYSSDKEMWNRLDKLCREDPKNWEFTQRAMSNGEEVARYYECKDKNLIHFRGEYKFDKEVIENGDRNSLLYRLIGKEEEV